MHCSHNIYADIINTKSFTNDPVLVKYINNEKIIQKIFSQKNEYCAINEDYKYIIITNNLNEILFKYKWDDEITEYPTSDTVYIVNWSTDRNVLWFLTYFPSEVAYIAKADIDKKQLYLFSIKTKDIVKEYTIDTENEIFYYSNYYKYDHYDDENEMRSLYKYNLKTKEEELIISRERRDGKFSPRIENGILVYNQ